MTHTRTVALRFPVAMALTGLVLGTPLALAACDKNENVNKSTTTKTTVTPDGVKKTTETTEKKVETTPKNP